MRLRHAGIHLAPQDEAEEPCLRHLAALTEDDPKNMPPEQQKAVEQTGYQLSPNGLISARNDQAERGWCARCQASSAIADGLMKKSSPLSFQRSRVQARSITASITI